MAESNQSALPGSPTASSPLYQSQPAQPDVERSRKRRRVRFHKPDESSLYDIMHENAGMSLYVRPIFWTDQHLRFLNISFDELPVNESSIRLYLNEGGPSAGHMNPTPTITTLASALGELMTPSYASHIRGKLPVDVVMSNLWPGAFSRANTLPELNLHFGKKMYRSAVRAPLLWEYPEFGTPQAPYTAPASAPAKAYPTGKPMICYIGRKQLNSVRRNLFRISHGPNGSFNSPVASLHKLRCKMLRPLNEDQDPHLAGIFLAMAQAHFPEVYAAQAFPLAPKPKFQDVTLRIIMDDHEEQKFFIYTTTVTRRFLERFHNPFRLPKPDTDTASDDLVPGMKITYTTVPFWPILGLRERMGEALGEDIVGPFDPFMIETWVDEEPNIDIHKTMKRKRDALSEVVNVSFDGDTDEETVDEPSLGGKKRCLSEGPPVGLVV